MTFAEILLKIVAALSCLFCLGCMSSLLYIFFSKKGDSDTVYLALYDTSSLNWKQKVFLGLAAIGFYICLFQGVEALLFWIPDYLRVEDESGVDSSQRESLSYAISITMFICAAATFEYLAKLTFGIRPLLIKIGELEKILEFSDNRGALTRMKNEYEDKIKCLKELSDDTLKYGKSRQILIEGPRYYEQYTELSKSTLSLLITTHQELVWDVEQALKKLDKTST